LTFLTPLALFGLAAAAIPILLHFFNLRKLRTIEFSTLSFLKELQRTKIHRLKLRQLLLLVLRTLLIVCIALAFSRPTLKGALPGGIAERAKTTAVIIIDDSQSMTASDEKGELIQQAKNAALGIVNILKDGDEAVILKLSDVPSGWTQETPQAQRNLRAVRSAIEDIKPSYIHRTIESALRYGAKLLTASKNFNKEIYLISDFQAGTMESASSGKTPAGALFEPTTQFFFIPIGTGEAQNASVKSIQIPSSIFEVNKPFVIKAEIANASSSELRNHIVSAFLDGERVAQKGVDIAAGRTANVEFTVVPRHAGYIEGAVEIEEDDLDFDNRRYFAVRIPDEIRVLMVGNKPDVHYIRLALQAQSSDSSAALRMSEASWDRFSASQMRKADVIIFSNPHEISQELAASVKTFLRNGGGLLLFPGNQLTSEAFNTTLARPLGISTIIPHEHQISQTQGGQSFVEFDRVDLQHPIFSGMFEKADVKRASGASHDNRTIESPRVSASLQFVPAQHSQTIITLTNGYPFLLEDRIGSGRALLVSIAANTEWSDLPVKGLFVPLIHRSITYLAQPSAADISSAAGDEVTLKLSGFPSGRSVIVKPGGIQVLVNPEQLGDNTVVRFAETDLPGIYSLKSGDETLDKFSINVDPDESNIARASDTQRERLVKRLGIASGSVHVIGQARDIQREVMETRLGTELWKYFLLAALIIAVAEMIAAREGKRALAAAVVQTE
jgi:hypothetical protein